MFLRINVSLLCLLCCLLCHTSATDNSECPKYKTLWESLKYPYADGKLDLSIKTSKPVCTSSQCCTDEMQKEMVAISKLNLKSIAEGHYEVITEWLTTSNTVLSDFMFADIDESRRTLNQMFQNTYSSNYKANEQFFVAFFNDLKQYIDGKGSENSLGTLVDSFLANMAERIVGMMMIAKKDAETVQCLAGGLLKMNPYQDARQALRTALEGAYPPARMLLNGLRAANDVFQHLKANETTPSADCTLAHSRAFWCPLCGGSRLRPCLELCRATMGRCLGALGPKAIGRLGKAWTKASGALGNLADRLLRPFNLVQVNKNIHVKISDAIMNVHNFFPTVRDKILANCKSQPTRQRRSSDLGDTFPASISSDATVKEGPDLPTLIKTFSAKLPAMKTHLKKYRAIVCDNKQAVTIGAPGQCLVGPGASSRKEKKGAVSPSVAKSIEKLNEIALVLNSLITGKNKDPKPFKIEYKPPPKRPARGDEDKSIESSGEQPTATPKTVPKAVVIQPNEEMVDGSGGGMVVTEAPQTNKVEFPKLPIAQTPVTTTRPEIGSVKKPVETDDEDLDENIPVKSKNGPPKEIIEGSGVSKSGLPVVTTTTIPPTAPPPPPHPPVRPLEGSGPIDDDEDKKGQRSPPAPPRFPVPVTDGAPPPTAASPLQPISSGRPPTHQDLPGDVPQEIWLPRVMEYAADGSLVLASKTGASLPRVVGTLLLIGPSLMTLMIGLW